MKTNDTISLKMLKYFFNLVWEPPWDVELQKFK